MAKAATKKKPKSPDFIAPAIVERHVVEPRLKTYRRKQGKRASRYPWGTLKVGQSFFVPVEPTDRIARSTEPCELMKSVIKHAFNLMKLSHPDVYGPMDMLIMVAEYEGRKGVRCWRVK